MKRKKAAVGKAAKKPAAPKKKVQPIPAGYNSVTPYLSIRGAAEAIEFYKKAFGAKEIMRMPGPDGKLGHAEIKIGDSRVMLSDEYEEMAFLSPQSRGGTTVHIHLYVKDVDATGRARDRRGREGQPAGRRTSSTATAPARSKIPFGHMWHVATHKEDLSMAEMTRARGAGGEAEAGLKNLQHRARRRAPAIAPAVQMLISP